VNGSSTTWSETPTSSPAAAMPIFAVSPNASTGCGNPAEPPCAPSRTDAGAAHSVWRTHFIGTAVRSACTARRIQFCPISPETCCCRRTCGPVKRRGHAGRARRRACDLDKPPSPMIAKRRTRTATPCEGLVEVAPGHSTCGEGDAASNTDLSPLLDSSRREVVDEQGAPHPDITRPTFDASSATIQQSRHG
jgi:hypothetical protein